MDGGVRSVSVVIVLCPTLSASLALAHANAAAVTATAAGACHHALGMHRAAVEDYQATLEAQSCLDGLMAGAGGEQGGTAVSTDLVQVRSTQGGKGVGHGWSRGRWATPACLDARCHWPP